MQVIVEDWKHNIFGSLSLCGGVTSSYVFLAKDILSDSSYCWDISYLCGAYISFQGSIYHSRNQKYMYWGRISCSGCDLYRLATYLLAKGGNTSVGSCLLIMGTIY
jgi:hypothetical protein